MMHSRTIGSALAAVFLSVVATSASAQKSVVVDFSGLTGTNGAPFSSYSEYGFLVRSAKLSNWLEGSFFGDNYIYYNIGVGSRKTHGGIWITHGGAQFTFSSVDIDTQVDPNRYIFTGYLKGTKVFQQHGVVNFSFSNPYPNLYASSVIDLLQITLGNYKAKFDYPLGLTNITLSVVGTNPLRNH